MRIILKILLISLFLSLSTNAHSCIHNDMQHNITVINSGSPKDLKSSDGRNLQQIYENIRIYADFSNLNSGSQIIDEYIRDQLVLSAISYLQAALKVVRLPDLLSVPEGLPCAGLYPGDELVYTGVEADLIILVTSENNPSVNYVAYSSPCSISQFNSRPLYGMLSINTAYLPINSAPDLSDNLYTAIHEIVHVLGFSRDLYPYYIDPNTNQYLSNPVGIVDINGLTVNYLNVEPLTTRVRQFFGCETAVGALLENNGVVGSAGSHFERRVFYNEFMTANAILDSRVSEFTLALLEGTGWYQVDYSLAEPFEWGRNQGCPFYEQPCMNPATSQPNFDEFCAPLAAEGCTFTSRAVALCGSSEQVYVDPSLPPSENYWGNGTAVIDEFSDNCPYFVGIPNADCENPANKVTAYLSEEYYGLGSRCFTGNLSPEGFAQPNIVGFCFPVNCQPNEDGSFVVFVTIGANVLQCTQAQTMEVPGLEGFIDCPDPNAFCATSNPQYCRLGCSGRGQCVNNVCQCPEGWSGADCSLRVYVDGCARCADQNVTNSCFGDGCWCNPNNSNCPNPALIGTGDGNSVDTNANFSFEFNQKGSKILMISGSFVGVIIGLFILN